MHFCIERGCDVSKGSRHGQCGAEGGLFGTKTQRTYGMTVRSTEANPLKSFPRFLPFVLFLFSVIIIYFFVFACLRVGVLIITLFNVLP